ncbi:hypothetical protein SynA1544_02775 [Synechococcus sp. A15-44]|nr:hypothetical protein SynA1544_02775 [Synechococcus sp. A15-44]
MTSSAKLVPTAWLLAWNQVFAPSRYFGSAVLNSLFVACVDLIGAAGSSRCCR